MAFEYMNGTVISICADCVYFNAYGRLDDTTMTADPDAADKHRAKIAAAGWPWGAEFTPGCGRECEEHGMTAVPEDWDDDGDCLREEDPEPWFSWSSCDECGSTLGGDREHATAWTYKSAADVYEMEQDAKERTTA